MKFWLKEGALRILYAALWLAETTMFFVIPMRIPPAEPLVADYSWWEIGGAYVALSISTLCVGGLVRRAKRLRTIGPSGRARFFGKKLAGGQGI